MEGRITAWSPGMQQRYGFTDGQAHGRPSHQLLSTCFPQALRDIQAVLVQQKTWSSGLIHRHADGRAVMTVNHWYFHPDVDDQSSLVTEVHSDVAHEGNGMYRRLADVLAVLAHELTEPLTAMRTHVDDAQRTLQPGWPDLGRVREAMAQASSQIARSAEGADLLRDLANGMRDIG
jgi:signal transduction histidine kinase